MIAKYFFTKAILNRYNISQEELFSRKRKKRLARTRTIMWWALRKGGYSFPSIGQYFKRDHSTIVKVLKKNIELMTEGIQIYEDAKKENIFEDLGGDSKEYDIEIVKIPDYHKNKIVEIQRLVKKDEKN